MPDDLFLIQFTSGTTGRAKGAALSHRNVVNAAWLRAQACKADETDVWVNPSPLNHMGGSVTIGRLTNSYFVGDRIDSIYPRMTLQTNIPTQQYPNRYPMVVQLTWRNEPEQSTTLQLDDRRSESDPVEL